MDSPVEGKKLLILQFMPRKSAGQVNICRDYCPICAMAIALQNKKKNYAGPRESSPPAEQKFLALHR